MDSKLVLAAAAFAVLALGAGSIAVIQSDGVKEAAVPAVTPQPSQPTASAVRAANDIPKTKIECPVAALPAWAENYDSKIDLARRGLLDEIYDKMRSEAVVKAGKCSCDLYHMPYTEAETVFEDMIGDETDPAYVNDMKRSVWKQGEKPRAAARKICTDYRW